MRIIFIYLWILASIPYDDEAYPIEGEIFSIEI
ncbi:hypothetical protein Xedl_02073 [Xenorhabdus eapokensis]|uniref:Uncharacterized protein n=1 Tax=Xenorhabdus eapokensis TaxID=1873482 RepID=A0A1Q5TRW1_9GAMM|nr:hypothetical protein Xedl_02073 [Xenorhabdus eapokensis]